MTSPLRLALFAAILLALAACAGDRGTDVPASAASATVQVSADGQALDLVDDGEVTRLAELPSEDGELVHASLRPGDQDALTVLALARVQDPSPPATDELAVSGPRYELRYLVVDELPSEPVTELYWFPWRLQVDATVAQVLDVPPIPVWAPDGSAIAWVEWSVQDGTKLRTIAWVDDGVSVNPSDDAVVYELDDVPAGVQLDRWETDDLGHAVLVGADQDANWRITVDLATGTLASTGARS